MKYLKGSDLVEYISERQSKQVRSLIQSKNIQPKLVIINTNPDHLPSQKYLELKKKRGEELGIKVETYQIDQSETPDLLKKLSDDDSVHGIILQLPLSNPDQTEELINLIPPKKDVDGLTNNSLVEPATVGAILWLLAGFNIDLKNKKILIIGQGKLVGKPLTKLLNQQNISVDTIDDSASLDVLANKTSQSDIIISAAGSPGLIKPEMLRNNQVIIDAGTSEIGGLIRGDIDEDIYKSELDIIITPKIGGLGPLTISYLFENLFLLIDKNS